MSPSTHRPLPLVLGCLALLTTSAILIIHVILVGHMPEDTSSPVRATGILSSVLEAIALSVLGWLFSTYFLAILPERTKRFQSISFGVSIMTCTLATVSSVATMICLGNSSKVSTEELLDTPQMNFMIGSSVALGLSFACQLIFIVVHFVLAKIPGHTTAHSLHTEEEGRTPPTSQIKSIPYSQTAPYANRTRGSTSMESRSPPPSTSGRSASETIRTSISSVIRPLSSRRLLSSKEKKRPASLDSPGRGSLDPKTAEDGFDSWDTSAVDPHHRQVLMQSTSPTPARFLETIPASPTTSRSPSPGCPLDLQPPRSRRRSRSYSPAPSIRPRIPASTSPNSSSPTSPEAHIHPLFRSDSPTPPPLTTPGTVVMAAPNAGQIISDRQSIRSLSRMRSGSLPAVPSPLSRQGSFEDFALRRPVTREEPAESIDESADETKESSPTERKMTPPIPDWILTAGTRTSLTGYNSRKHKVGDEDEQELPNPPLI